MIFALDWICYSLQKNFRIIYFSQLRKASLSNVRRWRIWEIHPDLADGGYLDITCCSPQMWTFMRKKFNWQWARNTIGNNGTDVKKRHASFRLSAVEKWKLTQELVNIEYSWHSILIWKVIAILNILFWYE